VVCLGSGEWGRCGWGTGSMPPSTDNGVGAPGYKVLAERGRCACGWGTGSMPPSTDNGVGAPRLQDACGPGSMRVWVGNGVGAPGYKVLADLGGR